MAEVEQMDPQGLYTPHASPCDEEALTLTLTDEALDIIRRRMSGNAAS